MNKFFILCSLLLSMAAVAQHTPAIVRGNYLKGKSTTITLYEVNEGEREEFAKTKLSSSNSFAFQLPEAKPGYYYLGTDANRGGTRIYLEPGIKLELLINDSSVQLKSASPENKLLLEWEDLRAQLRAMSRPMQNDNPALRRMADTGSFHSFFPKLESMRPVAESFKEKINSPNKKFNELLRFTVDADMQSMAVLFLLQPRSVHPLKQHYPAFYDEIFHTKLLNTAQIHMLGEGQDFINGFSTFRMMHSGEKPEKDKIFELMLQQVKNDTLKGDLVARRLGRANSFEEVLNNVELYGRYLKTEKQLAFKERAFEKLVKYQKGAPGFNFQLPDISGNTVSLQSLAGKVVVVDVWATWCGPCKAEIPFLKALTEEMKNQDIVFVSIGTDKEADKEKWKQFVIEKQLDGVQLYDPSGKSVISYYKIPGIPRFMVFDKNGKIVTVDAPRPSTPELKKLIEQYL